jgi:Papain family cysteine protease
MVALGRVAQFDERSRAFAAAAPGEVRTVLWAHAGGVLDQGDLGACTGFATAHAVNTRPVHKPRGRYLTGDDGEDLYSRATYLDPFPGVWPDDDTGSSGLAVCKAAKEAGHITRYEWAFGFDHLLSALQSGPVMVGTNWYGTMFHTDDRGVIDIGGRVVGGHEYLILGCAMRDEYATALNSWGPRWGVRGRFRIPFPIMRRLLDEDGDAVQPIR